MSRLALSLTEIVQSFVSASRIDSSFQWNGASRNLMFQNYHHTVLFVPFCRGLIPRTKYSCGPYLYLIACQGSNYLVENQLIPLLLQRFADGLVATPRSEVDELLQQAHSFCANITTGTSATVGITYIYLCLRYPSCIFSYTGTEWYVRTKLKLNFFLNQISMHFLSRKERLPFHMANICQAAEQRVLSWEVFLSKVRTRILNILKRGGRLS